MVSDTTDVRPSGPRLGEGEFPPELDRVNFGAFLLAILWAPFHRLWGWFGVFAVLEVLESVMGLSAPGFLGGLLEQPVVTVGFRIVYWGVTVVFALRANRFVWGTERKRAERAKADPTRKQPSLVSRYVSNQRVWTIAGLVLLAAMPLGLLVPSVSRVPGAAFDVAVTGGIQVVLLVGLFVYDRVRVAGRRERD